MIRPVGRDHPHLYLCPNENITWAVIRHTIDPDPANLTDMLSSKLIEPGIILLRPRNASGTLICPTNQPAQATVLFPEVNDVAKRPVYIASLYYFHIIVTGPNVQQGQAP